MTVDKAKVEAELHKAWDGIRRLVESLSERELTEPGMVDQWSIKDLLGHMAFWAEKSAGDLVLVTEGRVAEIETPGSEEILNEWNKRESERRNSLSIAELRDEFWSSFEAAAAAFRAVPAEKLDIDVKGWTVAHRFAEDTYKHYNEHAEHIRTWQRLTETTEA
jgi:hypothetical protein